MKATRPDMNLAGALSAQAPPPKAGRTDATAVGDGESDFRGLLRGERQRLDRRAEDARRDAAVGSAAPAESVAAKKDSTPARAECGASKTEAPSARAATMAANAKRLADRDERPTAEGEPSIARTEAELAAPAAEAAEPRTEGPAPRLRRGLRGGEVRDAEPDAPAQAQTAALDPVQAWMAHWLSITPPGSSSSAPAPDAVASSPTPAGSMADATGTMDATRSAAGLDPARASMVGNEPGQPGLDPYLDVSDTSADVAAVRAASSGSVADTGAKDQAIRVSDPSTALQAAQAAWAGTASPQDRASRTAQGGEGGSASKTSMGTAAAHLARFNDPKMQAAAQAAMAESSPSNAVTSDAMGGQVFARQMEAMAEGHVVVMPSSTEGAAAARAEATPLAPTLLGLPSAGSAFAALGPVAAPTLANLPMPMEAAGFSQALGWQLATLARDGVHEAQLQLNPVEMGPVHVQIVLDGAQAQIDFSATQARTREVLEASWPALAAAMDSAGFTLGGGGVSEQQARAREGDPQDARTPRRAPTPQDTSADLLQGGLGRRVGPGPRGLVDLYA